MALLLGTAAGLLQVLGYAIYIRKSVRRELEPNPATWFMFAYGTALLTVLELDLDAGLALLILPAICAALSMYVAYQCWVRGTFKWPVERADQAAFAADIILTVAYLAAWELARYGSITEESRHIATTAFLLCSNATTFTAFSPLLRDAYRNPDREHSPSWIVWALAYATLGLATALSAGWLTVLMVYPLTNAILHALVAWFARSSRHGGRKLSPSSRGI